MLSTSLKIFSRAFCRTLYENYLAGDKWKYIGILDEASIYLNDCNNNNKKNLLIIKIKKKKICKPGSINVKKVSIRDFSYSVLLQWEIENKNNN